MSPLVMIMLACSAAVLMITGTAVPASAAKNEVSIFLAGDTLLGRAMNRQNDEKTARIFRRILPFIQNSDLAFVNLECVISNQGHPVAKTENRPYFYRAHPRMVRLLSDAGIDIVSQANNHANDYGPEALRQNITLLKNAGIAPVGIGADNMQAARPVIQCINGISIAWIAFDSESRFPFAPQDRLGINFISEKDIIKTIGPVIDNLKNNTDVIIVSPHWGTNWKTSPTKDRQRIARSLIDRGAHMIAGHSSHISQGIEIYKDRPIIYDMGSFLFDSIADKRLRESFFFIARATPQGISRLEIRPIRLDWKAVDLEQPSQTAQRISDLIKKSLLISPALKKYIAPSSQALILNFRSSFFPFQLGRKACTPSPAPRIRPMAADRPNSLISRSEVRGSNPQPVLLRPGIEYLGGEAPATVLREHSFLVKTYFHALAPDPKDRWLIRLALISASGDTIYDGYSHDPGDWSHPTNVWTQGDIILDEYMFRPPKNMKPGLYDLVVSLVPFHKNTDSEEAVTKAKITSIEIQ